MTWLLWLAVAVVIAATAAVTGIKPKGTRPVARTQLLSVARFVLLLIAALLGYVAFRSRTGG
jgi:hypothetical protein